MKTQSSLSKVGFYAAVLTTVLTIVTFGIAFFTPPLGGPWCTSGCYSYPYRDIASRFPRDYYWMYPAMVLPIVYYTLMVSIHYAAPLEKKVFSHIGTSFGLISMAVFFVDYFLQVSVIQPSLLNGETDGIAMLSQFNAHGVFIVLEEIGFIILSLATIFLAPVFSRYTKVDNAIRWIFVANFVLTVLAFVVFSALYGLHREYRFEVASISINWLTLIVAGILLAVKFRRMSRSSQY